MLTYHTSVRARAQESKKQTDSHIQTQANRRHIHIYTPIQQTHSHIHTYSAPPGKQAKVARERRQGMQTGEADRDSRPQMPTANADMVDSDSRQQSRCTRAKADNKADVLQPKQRGQGGIHTKLNPKIQPNPTPKPYT